MYARRKILSTREFPSEKSAGQFVEKLINLLRKVFIGGTGVSLVHLKFTGEPMAHE
jgi:hypothetical protein